MREPERGHWEGEIRSRMCLGLPVGMIIQASMVQASGSNLDFIFLATV